MQRYDGHPDLAGTIEPATRPHHSSSGARHRDVRAHFWVGSCAPALGYWCVAASTCRPHRGRPSMSTSGGRALRARAAHLHYAVARTCSATSPRRGSWGWRSSARTRSLIHVTRRGVRGVRVEHGVEAPPGAVLRYDQVVVVDGVPVLDPARTALDIAREHGFVARHSSPATQPDRSAQRWRTLWDAAAPMACWPEVTGRPLSHPGLRRRRGERGGDPWPDPAPRDRAPTDRDPVRAA